MGDRRSDGDGMMNALMFCENSFFGWFLEEAARRRKFGVI